MSIHCTNSRIFGEGGMLNGRGGESCHGEMKAGSSVVYYGGDRLEGQLFLSGCEKGDFDVIKFSFQGIYDSHFQVLSFFFCLEEYGWEQDLWADLLHVVQAYYNRVCIMWKHKVLVATK